MSAAMTSASCQPRQARPSSLPMILSSAVNASPAITPDWNTRTSTSPTERRKCPPLAHPGRYQRLPP